MKFELRVYRPIEGLLTKNTNFVARKAKNNAATEIVKQQAVKLTRA